MAARKKGSKAPAKKQAGKKRPAKRKAAKRSAAKRRSGPSNGGPTLPAVTATSSGWSNNNGAHRAVYGVMLLFGQMDIDITFADAGKRTMSSLAFWATGASAATQDRAARDFARTFLGFLLKGLDSVQPRAGSSAQDWKTAFAAAEAMFLKASQTVADLGNKIDEQYTGW